MKSIRVEKNSKCVTTLFRRGVLRAALLARRACGWLLGRELGVFWGLLGESTTNRKRRDLPRSFLG